uniref:Heat shock cognate 70c n=1 Tax=Diaphanosoma celebensis TaxID=2184134 RepID=A0A8H2S6L8_9CRUS|nr:heat shock cognate 70c [Diaphanosoma celebensis]
MATTPVVGIDFGNESCFVAVARAGGIEVIINDYSQRDTPSCVAFTSKNRLMGTSAKNQIITNVNNTVFAFKRLIGLRFDDPMVAEEQKYLPYSLVPTQDGEVGFRVWNLGEEVVFSVRQIVAMLFTKLKEIAEAALECKVFECVVAVPYFFTDAQRRALLDAASIANLQVLRLLNEPSAAAVAYGLYRTSTELPNPDQPPRHVAFVDFGHSALQVAIAAFHKGKVKMLTTAFDPSLGGRSFDWMIAHQLAASFNRPNCDVTKNKRAWIRLVAEVEKLKRQMSANSTSLPIGIECLVEERDFSASMKRTEMEELCASLFQRVQQTMQRCLDGSGLKPDDIAEVELIGGSTRMPAVKNIIETVFGKVPSTTLNQDECVARGAAIMAAMLSPNFKVREFALTDLQPYAVNLSWGGEEVEKGEMEVFPKFHAVPFSKLLTFYRKGPFVLSARYADPEAAHVQKSDAIGQFQIQGVKPDAKGEAQKVKVKVRLNIHGTFQVVSATLMERQPAQANGEAGADAPTPTEAEGMETDSSADGQGNPAPAADTPAGEASKMETNDGDQQQADQDKAAAPAPKQIVKSIDLAIESRTGSMPPQQLTLLTEREAELQSQDKLERDRIDSKNALEEFVLAIRGRVNDSDDLEPFIETHVRDELVQMADTMENWLYDDGEDCEKAQYVARLQQLQTLAQPAQNRKRDHEGVPRAAEQFASALNRVQKALDSYKAGEALYDHWTLEEAHKLEQAIGEKKMWLDSNVSRARATPKTQDLPVKPSAFTSELQAFEAAVNPVLTKKKPPPPAPAPAAGTPEGSKAEEAPQPPPGTGSEKMETE